MKIKTRIEVWSIDLICFHNLLSAAGPPVQIVKSLYQWCMARHEGVFQVSFDFGLHFWNDHAACGQKFECFIICLLDAIDLFWWHGIIKKSYRSKSLTIFHDSSPNFFTIIELSKAIVSSGVNFLHSSSSSSRLLKPLSSYSCMYCIWAPNFAERSNDR